MLERILLVVLAGAGLAAALVLYPRVQPAADLGLSVGHAGALTRTAEYLTASEPDLERFTRRTAALHVLNGRLAYAQEVVLADEVRAAVDGFFPPAYWSVTFADPATEERHTLHVGVDGTVYRWRHVPPAGARSDALDRDAARVQAERFAAQRLGLDLAAFDLADVETTRGESRVDHEFTWQRTVPGAAGVRLRLEVAVLGDAVGGWSRSVALPAAFEARFQRLDVTSSVFQFWQFILAFGVWVFAFVVFALRFRAREVGLRNGLIVSGTLFLLYVVLWFNTLHFIQSMQEGPGDSEGLGPLWYVSLIINTLVAALGLFFVWASGESLTREVWPEKLHAFDGLFAGRLLVPALGAGILRGFALGFLTLGLVLLVPWTAARVSDVWMVVGPVEQQLLSARSPLLAVVAYATLAAFQFVGFALLFALPWLRLRLSHAAPAVILTLLLSFGILTEISIFYPRLPGAVAALIAGVPVFLFYLRYDLATAFVGVLVASVAPMLLALVHQPAVSLQAGGWVGFGLLGALLLLGLAALRFGRPLDDDVVRPTYLRYITERERMKMELDIARRAQLRMLPRELPRTAGLDIAAFSEPAREVGGDYYDFFALSGGRLAIAVGDVSGKGMPAALYMTMLKGSLQSRTGPDASPREVLTHVDRTFYQTAEPSMFVTLVFCIFDPACGHLRVARAGHHPVVVYRPADGSSHVLQPPGLGIGLGRDGRFAGVLEEAGFTLQPRDVVVLFTDGLVESRNAAGDEFDRERVVEVVRAHADASAETILARIREAHRGFLGRREPDDDLTCVVVRVTDQTIPG